MDRQVFVLLVPPRFKQAAIEHFRGDGPVVVCDAQATSEEDDLLAYTVRQLREHQGWSNTTLLTASEQLAVLECCSLCRDPTENPLHHADKTEAFFRPLLDVQDAMLQAKIFDTPIPAGLQELAALYAVQMERSHLVDVGDVVCGFRTLVRTCGLSASRFLLVAPSLDSVSMAIIGELTGSPSASCTVVSVQPYLPAEHFGDAFYLFTQMVVPIAELPKHSRANPVMSPNMSTTEQMLSPDTECLHASFQPLTMATPMASRERFMAEHTPVRPQEEENELLALLSGRFSTPRPTSTPAGRAEESTGGSSSHRDILALLSGGFSMASPANATPTSACFDPRLQEPNCFLSPGSVQVRHEPFEPSPRNGSHNRYSNIFQRFVSRLVLGFFQLVLNTRHDLAVMRLLAACEEEVAMTAFTGVCEPAMSLFQTTMSFVRKKQLGGKGYQDQSSALEPHRLLLAKIIGTFEKLQTCLQEELLTTPVGPAGFRRMLKIISSTLLSRDLSRVDAPSMAAVDVAMQQRFNRLLRVLPPVPHRPWRQVLQYFVDFETTTACDNCAHHHWTAETWYGDVPFSPSIAGMFLVEANPPPTQPSTISMALEAQPTASATTAQCLGPSQQDMDCAGPNLDERTRDKNLKNQTREAGCSHSDTIKKRPVHLGADVRNPKRRKAVPQITGQQKISGFFAHALMTTL